MKYEWETSVDGMSSIKYWYLIEPIGTFISVYPIVTERGLSYELSGPAGNRIYNTLSEAKEKGEAMARWIIEHPAEEIVIEDVPGLRTAIILPYEFPYF
jgi:hypothetical protein